MYFESLLMLVSDISFLFSFIIPIVPKLFNGHYFEFFAWLCVCGMLMVFLNRKLKEKGMLLPMILIFIPCVVVKGNNLKVICGLIGAYVIYNTANFIKKNRMYDEVARIFPFKMIAILIVLIGDSFFYSMKGEGRVVALFVLIYLTSAILMLRVMRYIKYNGVSKKFNSLNVVYAGGITLLTLMTTDYFRKIAVKLFDMITYGLIVVIMFIAKPLFWVFEKIAKGLHIKAKAIKLPIFTLSNGKKKGMGAVHNIHGIPYLYKFLILAAIIVVAAFLIKVVMRKVRISSDELAFIEEREFITERETGSKKLHKQLWKTEGNNEIRRIYQRYLDKCHKKGVGIEKYDTSLEVKGKSESSFNKDALTSVRDMYIKVRYGNVAPDKAMVEDFKDNYKRLDR